MIKYDGFGNKIDGGFKNFILVGCVLIINWFVDLFLYIVNILLIEIGLVINLIILRFYNCFNNFLYLEWLLNIIGGFKLCFIILICILLWINFDEGLEYKLWSGCGNIFNNGIVVSFDGKVIWLVMIGRGLVVVDEFV